MLVTKLFVSFQGYDPYFAFSSSSSFSLFTLLLSFSYILKMWLMKYWKERKVTPHQLVTIGWTIYIVLLITSLLSSFLFTKIDTILISFLVHFDFSASLTFRESHFLLSFSLYLSQRILSNTFHRKCCSQLDPGKYSTLVSSASFSWIETAIKWI